MTTGTVRRRRDVIDTLAARQRAVVTGRAQRDRGLQVIKCHYRTPPCRRLRMAGVAQITGNQSEIVFSALAHRARERTVMASNAVTGERRVIGCRLRPCHGGLMAVLARQRCRDVRGGFTRARQRTGTAMTVGTRRRR